MSDRVTLLPIDIADVTILVDNFVDLFLPGTEIVRRAPLVWEWSEREQLIAEHGYSLLLTVQRDGRTESVLYDAGLGRNTVLHNMDVLDLRSNDLRAVILSHGHADHHGGREGVTIVEERGPSLLLDGMVLVTGQVERVTDFEKGFPLQQARTNGGWEPDTWIWDDQAVVCHLKDKGLVVLSGCSHAGVINVLRHAQRLTGIDTIYAFVGGLHLTGGIFEPIIPRTISELAAIGPTVVVPGHCTGWKATHEVARKLPEAYIQTSVGTRLHFA